jgi:hypothetical protein
MRTPALFGLLAFSACGIFGSGGRDLVAKVVNCGAESIRKRGLIYLGDVNDILGNREITEGEAKSRLARLGTDAGQDVIGCLLKDQASKFAESAGANPEDTTSIRAARRAEGRLAELEQEGWRFE